MPKYLMFVSLGQFKCYPNFLDLSSFAFLFARIDALSTIEAFAPVTGLHIIDTHAATAARRVNETVVAYINTHMWEGWFKCVEKHEVTWL